MLFWPGGAADLTQVHFLVFSPGGLPAGIIWLPGCRYLGNLGMIGCGPETLRGRETVIRTWGWLLGGSVRRKKWI